MNIDTVCTYVGKLVYCKYVKCVKFAKLANAVNGEILRIKTDLLQIVFSEHTKHERTSCRHKECWKEGRKERQHKDPEPPPATDVGDGRRNPRVVDGKRESSVLV